MQPNGFPWPAPGSNKTSLSEAMTPEAGTTLDASKTGRQVTNEASERAAAEAAEAERRRSLLRLILSDEASERLARVALVKPDKARAVEDYLLRAVRFGELAPGTRVTETQLIALLQRLHSDSDVRPRVTIARRRTWSDDEDD